MWSHPPSDTADDTEEKKSSHPLPYTENPIYLLWKDVTLFFRLTFDMRKLSLLSIIWPVRPASSKLHELAMTEENMWSMFVHAVLIVVQLAYLAFTVIAPLLGTPAVVYFFVLVAGIWTNKQVCCIFLNFRDKVHPDGRVEVYSAGSKYSNDPLGRDARLKLQPAEHPDERWVFVNGVAAGSHWLDCNLQRIAKTFQRPIIGIHNATYGIIFDVLECIIQRSFTYTTTDIRAVYRGISELVQDPSVETVVLIAHSQGCIELGLALDWLYVTLPTEEIKKIEVYTFGNAANHWNCPKYSKNHRVISHVEHYANKGDWVARFGVMFFRGQDELQPYTQLPKVLPTSGVAAGPGISRHEAENVDLRNGFVGKLFLREGFGHQFNQHYLNNMFAMDQKDEVVLDDNDFMRSAVNHENYESGKISPAPASDVKKLVNGKKGLAKSARRFEDESRLWQYRNGGVPKTHPSKAGPHAVNNV